MTAVIEIQKHELIEQDRGRDYSDVVRMLLESKRSENTRRGYRKDLEKFFREMHVTGREMCPETVNEFLSLPRAQAVSVVLQYKADLIHKGLAEATINRRLAAIKSLVNFARKVDRCSWDLSDIEGERWRATGTLAGQAWRRWPICCRYQTREQLKEKGIMPLCGYCGKMPCGEMSLYHAISKTLTRRAGPFPLPAKVEAARRILSL